MQMGPQIRLIQSNDTMMAEKIQSTIVNTIPLWKNQMVLALGLAHSQQAMQAERAVTDMTNELLKKNADALKLGTIETAKESERGVVDIETLQQTNKSLIETLDELNKIRADGKAKRANAEQELGRIEGELRQKMLEIQLKGVYRETAEIYTSAQDEYGHSIQGDFETQADAAANLIKQAGYVDSTPAAALQEAEDALAAWNDTDDSPAVQYAANRRLYNAVDTLYASLNNKVDDSTQRALDDQYNAFVSAQATIERAANVYNLWVEDYEKTVSQFPANLISGLWGAQAPERFATK